MALIDSYRNSVSSKSNQLMKLREDRSKEVKKKADIVRKIQKASEALSRTKSQATIKSKYNEITRLEKQAAQIDKKISDIETKISKKEKELVSEQTKLSREEIKVEKKRQSESDKRAQEQTKKLSSIDFTLKEHTQLIEKLNTLPERIKVLFLAMSPRDQEQLSLDEEARAITEMISRSKHRDSVDFVSCWAVRPFDVLQAINVHEPSIVHFSGHGSEEFIAFQDNFGNTKPVSTDAIVQTMMASSSSIRLVFFNTCHSRDQAKSVVQHVEASVGMNDSIGDEAARVFASQFYSSIGFGHSVERAFQQAKALLMLEGIKEENTPELFTVEGLNSDEIVIVNPV